MTENGLQLLEQNARQINMNSNNLSLMLDYLLDDLTNLNDSINTLRVSWSYCTSYVGVNYLNIYNDLQA